jgi:long-chain fatty acid transport protein
MKRTLISFAVLGTILGSSLAQAGGYDRSGQDTSIIFAEGNAVEITYVTVKPSVTGTYDATAQGAATFYTLNPAAATGSVAPSYNMTNIAFKMDINDEFSLAVINDSPFGADVAWTSGMFTGTKGKIKSNATTALLSYAMDNNVTVYGGLKSQSISADAAVPLKTYEFAAAEDTSLGYVIGAAIAKPEIGMRVALTFHPKIKHTLSVVETVGVTALDPVDLEVTLPDALNLGFQTGIAANTLLFGSLRYVKWSQTEVAPAQYKANALLGNGAALLVKGTDVVNFNLGVGRKFNDLWSGAITYGSERKTGDAGSAFTFKDGYKKIGLGVTYTAKQAKITIGVQKVTVGDLDIAIANGTAGNAAMASNDALVTAVKIAYKF